MNYNSQLLGWAIDRVTEMWKVTKPEGANLEMLQTEAAKLAEFCYQPDGDFNDCIQRVVAILKVSPDALEKVNQLQGELAFIAEDIERQVSLRSKMTANDNAAAQH